MQCLLMRRLYLESLRAGHSAKDGVKTVGIKGTIALDGLYDIGQRLFVLGQIPVGELLALGH